jgi:hypothetical protein
VFHVKKRSITLVELKNMKAFFNEMKDGSGKVTVSNLKKDSDSRANAGLQTAGTAMGADLFNGKVKAYLDKRPTQKGINFFELLKLMFTVNDEMAETMIAALTPDAENAPIKFKAMSREQQQWLDDMWANWDADASGELDKYEMQEVRVSHCVSLTGSLSHRLSHCVSHGAAEPGKPSFGIYKSVAELTF